MIQTLSNCLFRKLWLGWLWLVLIAIHITFFSSEPPSHFILVVFDKVMIASSFLIYIIHGLRWDQFFIALPFLLQFLFWGLVGIFSEGLYRFLSKSPISSLRD